MQIESLKFMHRVRDMRRAVRFYRDVLGLVVKFESLEWTELGHGDAIVALHGGGTEAEVRTGLSIQVASLDRACREVAAGGGRIVSPPHARPNEPIRLAEIMDTEGNIFSMTEYRS
jgi:predicted enzyme related to lactoylglutathione lyase